MRLGNFLNFIHPSPRTTRKNCVIRIESILNRIKWMVMLFTHPNIICQSRNSIKAQFYFILKKLLKLKTNELPVHLGENYVNNWPTQLEFIWNILISIKQFQDHFKVFMGQRRALTLLSLLPQGPLNCFAYLFPLN